MKKIAIVVLFILLVSAMQAGAYESRKVVNTKLIESEYNLFGTPLPFGDRLYLVTYEGGQQQYVVTHGTSIGKATIVESTSTVWCTAGKTCDITFRAKAPNLPRFAANGFATHKFELYDDSGSYPFVVATRTPNPLIDSQVPASYGKLEMFTLPDSYLAGKKYMFIKEYVQDRTTGQWIAGYDSGSSELRLDVVYTESVQATPTPTPSSASLKIESSPQGAVVTASGSYLGTTPLTLALQAGESMIIKFDLAGYVTQYKGVSSSSSNPFLVIMVPVTAPIPTPVTAPIPTTTQGHIIVWSYPSEAKVYVNDVEKGTTGAEWLSIQMPVGAYTVKVVKGGYETYSQSVTVVANDNAKVEARMSVVSTSESNAIGTPASTSGMTLETTEPKTTSSYECPQGTVWNADRTGCIVPKKTIGEKIDQSPSFEAVFAIAGLFAVAYLILRQKEKKEDDEE